MVSAFPSVERTLSGKTLLITGTTGFLAKVFLEKLLRTCPTLGTVYLLVRAPGAAEAEDRVEKEILASPLFTHTAVDSSRVRAIRGDTTEPRLGMDPEDYLRLLSEVDFVVNSAASTDFRDPIVDAIRTNTVSVQNIIAFVKSSVHARLLHVSTCYVNETGSGAAAEEVARQPQEAQFRLPERSEDIFALLNAELPALNGVDAGWNFARRHGWNNVYTFGKWLGEKILLENIPCTILRPSIIESCIHDPIPGWIEGFKVADPLFYVGGKDLLKCFPGDESAIMDVIPVDMVANGMILALNELACTAPAVRIYQASSSVENPVSLKKITAIVRGGFGNGHLKRPFFIPGWIFYVLINTLRYWLMLTRQAGMLKQIDRINKLAQLYQPYSSLKRTFESRKLNALHARSAPIDRLRFSVDSARINWTEYLASTHIPGLEKFVISQGRIKL